MSIATFTRNVDLIDLVENLENQDAATELAEVFELIKAYEFSYDVLITGYDPGRDASYNSPAESSTVDYELEYPTEVLALDLMTFLSEKIKNVEGKAQRITYIGVIIQWAQDLMDAFIEREDNWYDGAEDDLEHFLISSQDDMDYGEDDHY